MAALIAALLPVPANNPGLNQRTGEL